jgi:hypothetical protein
MWEEAPVSRYHSAVCGPKGGTFAVVSAARSACWFQMSFVGGLGLE